MTRLQTFWLQGVLPILMIGILLPLGLIALFRAALGSSMLGTIEHGELYLAGGNAAFTGCLVFASSRVDIPAKVAIGVLPALVLLTLPCYALWALLTVLTMRGEKYSSTIATTGGGYAAGLCIVIGLVFVYYSHRPEDQQSP